MKFGGSSVADAECMRQALALVREALPRAPLVVLSAMGKTTDALFALARTAEAGNVAGVVAAQRDLLARHRDAALALLEGTLPRELDATFHLLEAELDLLSRAVCQIRALSPRAMDAIASIGERLSTVIFAAYLESTGIPVTLIDARTVLRTDDQNGAARPIMTEVARLAAQHLVPHLGPGRAVVTQGYIGSTADGITTTLGRGGSDYTAAILGAAVRAAEVQIWTDVEGVLTADPRIIPDALPIAEVSFAEAAELAAFGAKVLHPSTIQPAVDADVPVTVRHTHRPDGRFTRIGAHARSGRPVTALAGRGPVTVLTVTSTRMLAQPGFLARLFDVFARHRVSVDLVSTAEVSVSLTIEADAPVEKLTAEIAQFATVDVARDRAIVAIVGERLRKVPGLAARAFTALGDLEVEMVSMGANEINLSLIVSQVLMPEALRRLHRALIEGASA